MDRHQGRIPFINWKAGGAWSAIASGSQDATIIAGAEAIKDFGYPMYLTFHHEPENDLDTTARRTSSRRRSVTSSTSSASRDVTNVACVWTMMGWSFDPRSGRDALSYYPGDSYIDFVGSPTDTTGTRAATVEVELVRDGLTLTRRFAVAHSKPWMAVEYGVQEDPAVPGRKAEWFARRAGHGQVLARTEGPDLLRHDEALPVGHG